jgi:S-adenosylmethionine:diacylglycerol 3-amino-3-carboxypropyl transferase
MGVMEEDIEHQITVAGGVGCGVLALIQTWGRQIRVAYLAPKLGEMHQ